MNIHSVKSGNKCQSYLDNLVNIAIICLLSWGQLQSDKT
uniref:Uncharacterized protein n=1 Tax=Tetranychus urticae TaxID=32264 RepID=T1JRJ5_TETUR